LKSVNSLFAQHKNQKELNMKKGILMLALASLTSVSYATRPVKNLADLARVTCKSTFEGQDTIRVTSTAAHDKEGYTVVMTLLVDRLIGGSWYKQNFQTTQADYPQSKILVLHGVNRRGEPLVLTMPLSDDPVKGDSKYMDSDIQINGQMQDYLKFSCMTNFAG
jgi:hypothetical protein